MVRVHGSMTVALEHSGIFAARCAAGTSGATAPGSRGLRHSFCGGGFVVQRRWHNFNYKLRIIRQRASEQHVDYLKQLKPTRQYRQVDLDPKLVRPLDEIRQVFNHPEIVQQPQEERHLKPLEKILTPSFEGQLGEYDLAPFGRLEVVHGDIFQAEAKLAILPMAPNLVPYRGLSLEAFDRGGPNLVKNAFNVAKEQYRDQGGLQAGDTIVVNGYGTATESIMFVVMPWFWQGSPMDAGKRFRHCIKSAFGVAAGPQGFESVVLPHVGGGIFGYEPRNSSRTMMEEAVEALLQIEAQVPSYKLKRLTFIDSRRETAYQMNEALTEVAHRWLPDHKLTTAPQYWGKATRRLLVLPAVPNFFLKRDRVKFKKFHGVERRQRKKYRGNFRPWLWRPHRVQQPPPLLVYQSGEQSGASAPADLQPKARPYFFRGVTHWLFPSRRSGFHALRTSSKGAWIAQLQHMKWREAVRPRL